MVQNKKHSTYAPLVITGYTVFALLLLSVLVSTTIPMGIMLFDPRVIHYNVAVFAITLTVGALLPFLLGYVIGDHSVKSKKKISHHFNGVLFGLLGYWVMTLAALFISLPDNLFGGDFALRAIVMNSIPSILVGLVAIVLATMHVRSRHAKHDVIDYKPFSITLIGAIVLLQLCAIVNNVITNSVSVYTFVAPVLLLVLGSAVYVSLRKTKLTTYNKITWAAVSLSVALMISFVVGMFAHDISAYLFPYPTMNTQTATSIAGTLIALVGWVTYWVYQRRSLLKK